MSDFPDLEISHYPRMERPGERSTLVIPTGPEWTEQMGILLEVTKIPPANSVQRRFRKVGRGQNKRSMPAKHCAPGITAYTVPQGSSRGRRTAEMAPWNWLPLDLDAVPLGINETLEIVRKAIDVRAVAWTTWNM